MHIEALQALEILDSRGQPTLQVTLTAGGGARFVAGVPVGASTGSREAVERRDADAHRYAGRGVLDAAAAVNGPIAALLTAQHDWTSLTKLDEAVCTLDGTADKSQLGANAIVGASMAAAAAFAASAGQPLYRYLAQSGVPMRLPVPHFNVLNGGAHAQNLLEFQEFMLAPVGAPSVAEAVRCGAEVYASLRNRLTREGLTTGLGDEGGFAPEITDAGDACRLLVTAIEDAGYQIGPDGVMLALDPAATGFYNADGRYRLDGQTFTSTELVGFYTDLVDRFPIWSIEDGCAESDANGWRLLTETLGARVQIVGDDIFVTDSAAIQGAAQQSIANAALIKVNQVGTVTEALSAVVACARSGFTAMVSHRSGETVDVFIADLAVGVGCGQLKAGAPARGERVAKYNRLLTIASEDPALPYGLPNDALRRLR